MSSGPEILLIFDVDGTLLMNGTVVRDIFYDVFREVCGREAVRMRVNFSGLTDKGIFEILLSHTGIKGDPEKLFMDFVRLFTFKMKTIYPRANGPRLLPGVRQLLDAISNDSRFALALGTGNIRETCYIKLKRFSIDSFFPVGGFGDEHEDRGELIRSAMVAAADYYRMPKDPGKTWVIGDTARDVTAGKKNDTRTLAVASGFVSKVELLESGADAVFNDFTDFSEIISVLSCS